MTSGRWKRLKSHKHAFKWSYWAVPMMKAALLVCLIGLQVVALAQNMSVNKTGASPDASAMLDVSDTTSGFLMPRMTQSQMLSISSPANGLMVIQTDGSAGLYIYDGTLGSWNHLLDSNQIAALIQSLGAPGLDSVLIENNDAGGEDIINVGAVGIGTATPASRLHVYEPSATATQTIQSGSGDDAEIEFMSNTDKWLIDFDGNNNAAVNKSLLFGYNGVKHLTLQGTTGKVGIGTLSPDSLLHVSGGMSVKHLNINATYTFPSSDGTSDQVLMTDGSGNVTWESVISGDSAWKFGSEKLYQSTRAVYVGDTVIPASFYGMGGLMNILNTDSNISLGVNAGGGDNPDNFSISGIFTNTNTGTNGGLNKYGLYTTSEGGSGTGENVGIVSNAQGGSINKAGNFSAGTSIGTTNIGISLAAQHNDNNIGLFAYSQSLNVGDSNVAIYAEVAGNTSIKYAGIFKGGQVRIDDTLKVLGAIKMGNEYTFPSADGTTGQFLQSDGSGSVNWSNVSWNRSLPDTLGVHLMTKNMATDTNWISGDGDDEGLYIDASGKVILNKGIYHDLNTSGDYIAFSGNNALDIAADDFMTLRSGKYIHLNVAETVTRLAVTDSGVGMGTITPNYDLHITSAGTANDAQMVLTNSDASHAISLSSGHSSTDPFLSWQSGDDLLFATNASGFTERARLTSAGRFGIGTTNPQSLLHVHDNSGTQSTLRLSHTGTASLGFWIQSDNSQAYLINYENTDMKFATDGTDRMIITDDGKVGVGFTSPSASLHVRAGVFGSNFLNNGIYLHNSTNSAGEHAYITARTEANGGKPVFALDINTKGGYSLAMNHSDTSLRFHSVPTASGTPIMTMTLQRDVGIGTTAPSSKLDVNGDVEVGSGDYYYLGDPDTNGSWRIGRSGNNLAFERREGGVWVTKTSIVP